MGSEDTKFIALDLELNQPSGKIIQVGVCIGSLGMPEEEYITSSWLLDPGEPIAPFITELTGIHDKDIQNLSVPWQVFTSDLTSLLQTHQPFINPVTWGGGDCTELLQAIRQEGIDFPFFGRRWIDVKTLHVFERISAGRSTSGGLGTCLNRYGKRFVGIPHRADADALNTLRLFFEMIRKKQRTDEAIRLLTARD